MDSLTQAALGASVAYAVSGRRHGKKALLAGALLGSLPDLDVLFPYADAVDNFTYHRSWSHSLIVLTVVSPVLAWITGLVLRSSSTGVRLDRNLLLMVWLVFVTHTLLDSCTVYGTQLFWPLNSNPVGIGNIFIIDPLYTLPLLVAIVWVIWKTNRVSSAARVSRALTVVNAALLLSTSYLLLTLVVQSTVTKKAETALGNLSFDYETMAVLPAPGSLLWRVVARNKNEYLEGFYSVLHRSLEIDFTRHETNDDLLEPIADYPPVKRLQWFTKGLYASRMSTEGVELVDLRMGVEAQYVFAFQVGRREQNGSVSPLVPTRLVRFNPDLTRIKELLRFVIEEPDKPGSS